MVEEEQKASAGLSQQADEEKELKRKKWLKRLGVAGFLFFFIKGLVWIAIVLFAWKGCSA